MDIPTPPAPSDDTRLSASWYPGEMESLIGIGRQLSEMRDVHGIAAIVRDAARNLTGADGATFVLRDGEQCYYVDESAIAPLWKGKRFSMGACISGWVMLKARPVLIEDIYRDTRIPIEAYRPTFVKSLAMVPIRRGAPIGAIGNYWATQRMPTTEELSILQALADTASAALENAGLDGGPKREMPRPKQQASCIDEQRDPSDMATSSFDRMAALATVLLVDDLEDHLELTRLMLFDSIALKCNIVMAHDGVEALDVIHRTIAGGGRIDLILLDIDMPRMDGFELMQHFGDDAALKNLSVVMCTGSNYDDDRKRARSLGAAGYLVKPPSWEQLKPILENTGGVRVQHNAEGAQLFRAA